MSSRSKPPSPSPKRMQHLLTPTCEREREEMNEWLAKMQAMNDMLVPETSLVMTHTRKLSLSELIEEDENEPGKGESESEDHTAATDDETQPESSTEFKLPQEVSPQPSPAASPANPSRPNMKALMPWESSRALLVEDGCSLISSHGSQEGSSQGDEKTSIDTKGSSFGIFAGKDSSAKDSPFAKFIFDGDSEDEQEDQGESDYWAGCQLVNSTTSKEAKEETNEVSNQDTTETKPEANRKETTYWPDHGCESVQSFEQADEEEMTQLLPEAPSKVPQEISDDDTVFVGDVYFDEDVPATTETEEPEAIPSMPEVDEVDETTSCSTSSSSSSNVDPVETLVKAYNGVGLAANLLAASALCVLITTRHLATSSTSSQDTKTNDSEGETKEEDYVIKALSTIACQGVVPYLPSVAETEESPTQGETAAGKKWRERVQKQQARRKSKTSGTQDEPPESCDESGTQQAAFELADKLDKVEEEIVFAEGSESNSNESKMKEISRSSYDYRTDFLSVIKSSFDDVSSISSAHEPKDDDDDIHDLLNPHPPEGVAAPREHTPSVREAHNYNHRGSSASLHSFVTAATQPIVEADDSSVRASAEDDDTGNDALEEEEEDENAPLTAATLAYLDATDTAMSLPRHIKEWMSGGHSASCSPLAKELLEVEVLSQTTSSPIEMDGEETKSLVDESEENEPTPQTMPEKKASSASEQTCIEAVLDASSEESVSDAKVEVMVYGQDNPSKELSSSSKEYICCFFESWYGSKAKDGESLCSTDLSDESDAESEHDSKKGSSGPWYMMPSQEEANELEDSRADDPVDHDLLALDEDGQMSRKAIMQELFRQDIQNGIRSERVMEMVHFHSSRMVRNTGIVVID